MILNIKKDYSSIEDESLRKKEFFDDLKDLIRQFEESEDVNELIQYYD